MISEFERLPELTDEQLQEINECFTSYIFYKKEKRKLLDAVGVPYTSEVYQCTCTNCNSTYIHNFEGSPKHNSIVKCPECERTSILKHVSYGKKNLWEQQRVVLFCPENENAVWLRAFYATKTYNGDPEGNRMLNSLYTKNDEELTPSVDLSETARYLLVPGSARCFKYDYGYYSTHTWYEVNPREPFTSYMGQNHNYTIIYCDRLDKTFLKYININEWFAAAEKQYCIKPWSYYGPVSLKLVKYICEFVKYPIIESVMKSGFAELVVIKILDNCPNKRYLNWDATRLADFFRTLTKPEVRALKEEDYKSLFLRTYSEMKKINSKVDMCMCHTDLKRYGSDKLVTLLNIVKKYKLNYTKAKNYLKKQNPENEKYSIQIWKDYLDMAQRLSYDLKSDVVLYPKYLQKSHDEAAKNVSALIREEQVEKMKELTKKLRKRYAFSWHGLEIVVPESMQEIIEEGKVLSHCVGGYAERHANGRLAILFIRKQSALDVPFVTMEINGTNIIQVHGYRNDREKPLPKEVKDFVEEFKLYISNPVAYNKINKTKEKKSA